MQKTYAEINAKIKSGEAVVMTAEELINLVEEKGIQEATQEVDVVTTGTFAPMCSSGVFLNFGHSNPKMKMSKVWLNNIPAYAGIAAVDAYLGATELPEDDPLNSKHPGQFRYGGGHLIEELVAGKEIELKATAYGTDCYPRTELSTTITLDDLNEAILFNPRNCYQNYNCAINTTDKTIYTYMGMLKEKMGNATYSTAGQLSPLLKDPYLRTIGLGTKIFLGGGIGYVAWNGTQHFPSMQTDSQGNELGASGGTLALIGDLKQMSPKWIKGTSYLGYGATLSLAVGIPIPLLNEEITKYAAKKDEDLYTQVIDYGKDYPNHIPSKYPMVSYAQLKSGEITVEGKKIPTAPLSSYSKAKEIANILKDWIKSGEFLLTEPVKAFANPDNHVKSKTLKIK